MQQPRAEYPRPQFVRPEWVNLNGTWEFEMDPGKSGAARGLSGGKALAQTIQVPFCPESSLSGIAHTDFIPACWYRRSVSIPKDWLTGRLLLNFGAVNYLCKVWVNGHFAGEHKGGYVSWQLDIRDHVIAGDNEIVVYAESDVRQGVQPSGKQSSRYDGYGCYYTRTTGIWQTVWLEPVAETYAQQIFLTPDVTNKGVHVRLVLPANAKPGTVLCEASLDGKAMGSARFETNGTHAEGFVALAEAHLWNVGAPVLYDLSLRLEAADTVDTLQCYFGLRDVAVAGQSININGKPVYQRLVLDQGFNPDGIITAPSDAELKADIERSIAMGFNGARLHQKIFEPRFLYWADRLGYIIWGEHGNWGLNIRDGNGLLNFLPEWVEAVQRDYSSPALIGWCPFNETQPDTNPLVLKTTLQVTKALDATRPVIDTSGWVHCEFTDVYDYHDYEQDPEKLLENVKLYASAEYGKPFPKKDMPHFMRRFRPDTTSKGQPIFVSEFGGIGWKVGAGEEDSWGYGEYPKTEAAFLERLKGQMDAVLDTEGICGFCYTQLTDTEQEINGMYTYGREPKFPSEVIAPLINRPAWNEKGE